MQFCHLHNHTQHSILDGYGTAEQYVEEASRLGFEYLAITDHGNIDGAIKFQKACEAKEIKSLIGCELYVVDDMLIKQKGDKRYHMTVIVENAIGWKNLLKLLTIANTNGFYYRPRVDMQTFLQYGEGLAVMTGCSLSVIHMPKFEMLISELIEVVGKNNLFFEVMPHNLDTQIDTNELVLALAEKYEIDIVATNDCHYPTHEYARAQEMLLAIQSKAKWTDKDRWRFDTDELYLKSDRRMKKAFIEQKVLSNRQIDMALENTIKIAEMCGSFRIEKVPVELPSVFEKDEDVEFEMLVDKGFYEARINIDRDNIREYRQRIRLETKAIKDAGFIRYFLIVWELINWCKENNIMTGPGRGSVGGSLIAYLLGITDVDPIKYNLLFARFISPGRCFEGHTRILVNGFEKKISDVKIGDKIINKYGKQDVVKNVKRFSTTEKLFKIWFQNKYVICTFDHKWIVRNKFGEIIEKQTKDLLVGEDQLIQIK